jgi:hypothetical protein
MIGADLTILNNVKLTMTSPPPIDGWFFGGEILLQFPPRVKSHSKAANWRIKDAESYEPIVFFIGNKETKVSLELKYVVGAGSGWGVDKISKIIHDIKGYFYRGMSAGNQGTAPLLEMRMYEIAPETGLGRSTWRMNSVVVTPSDELILDKGKIYPQISTIALDLSMLTQISDKQKKASRQTGFGNAQIIPLKEWY